MTSEGPCLPSTSLPGWAEQAEVGGSLRIGLFDDCFDWGVGDNDCVYLSGSWFELPSGWQLGFANLAWAGGNFLNGNSIYQLPAPIDGTEPFSTSFNIVYLNDPNGGARIWQEGNLDHFDVRYVPEPGTLALLGIGLAGMGLARRRRKV